MKHMDHRTLHARLAWLHHARLLTHAQYLVGCALLRCQGVNQERFRVSYRRMAQLAGVAASTAKEAARRLAELGVLRWHRTHVRVSWRLLRAANVYWFIHSRTGSDGRSGVQKQDKAYRKPVDKPRSVAEQLRILTGAAQPVPCR